MTNKKQNLILAFVVVMLCFCSAASVSGQQLELKVDKRIRIEAPEGFTSYKWDVPAPLKYSVSESQQVAFVEGPAGTYRIEVEGTFIDWDNRIFKQQEGYIDLVIGEPGPNPGPGPKPPLTPNYSEFIELIPSWATSVNAEYRQDEAKRIAKTFREFASKTGNYPTIGEFTKATSDAYKLDLGVAGYQPWQQHVFIPLTQKLSEYRDSNKLGTLDEFGAAWLAIADGFERVK